MLKGHLASWTLVFARLASPTAPSRQAQTTNAEGASCQLDLGLCYRLGSPTAHLGQAQKTNAKRATLLAGLRPLLQPGFPNLFKSKLQRGRRRLYWKLSEAVTDYIISVHDCKSYAINAVSGLTKKCLLVMYQMAVHPIRLYTRCLLAALTMLY